MLVCNVILRPAGRTIAADLAEAIAATDATATGNLVFATLVDDPASVADIVDAYSGEIMLEAAVAGDSADAGMVYVVAIDEAVTAADLASVYDPAVIAAAISEPTTANSAEDATLFAKTALVEGAFTVVFVTPPTASVSVLTSGTLLTA